MSQIQTTNVSKEILLEMVMCLYYSWKQHPYYQEQGPCAICFDESMIGEYVLETACGHRYHRSCLITTLIHYKFKECPCCRSLYKKLDID